MSFISARSRRDLREITNLPEISSRLTTSRRDLCLLGEISLISPRSRRDLVEISATIQISPRSRLNFCTGWWYLKNNFDSLHGGYWSEEMKIDVSTDSLALLSPNTEQYEIFLCNGSVRYKTEWDTEVNFHFVLLFSVDIHWILLPLEHFEICYS